MMAIGEAPRNIHLQPLEIVADRSSESNASRLAGIDCCRGIAAVLVVLAHSTDIVSKSKYFDVKMLGGCFQFGAHGVDFFFVLSGFIISYVHWRDLGRADRVVPYFAKRFARIYPTLWAVAIPFFVLSLLANSERMPLAWMDRAEVGVTSVLLLPSKIAPLPVVVWTLKHEALFYLLFGFVLWRPRLGAWMLSIWAVACCGHLLVGLGSNFLSDFFFSPYNLEFLLGVGCGSFLRVRRNPFPFAASLAGALLLGVGAVLSVRTPELTEPPPTWIINPIHASLLVLFGSGSALLVLGIAQLDMDRRTFVPRIFAVLGAASYSIYLTHLVVLLAGCRIMNGLRGVIGYRPVETFILIVVGGIGGGVLFHYLVEKRVVAWTRKALSPLMNCSDRAMNAEAPPA